MPFRAYIEYLCLIITRETDVARHMPEANTHFHILLDGSWDNKPISYTTTTSFATLILSIFDSEQMFLWRMCYAKSTMHLSTNQGIYCSLVFEKLHIFIYYDVIAKHGDIELSVNLLISNWGIFLKMYYTKWSTPNVTWYETWRQI